MGIVTAAHASSYSGGSTGTEEPFAFPVLREEVGDGGVGSPAAEAPGMAFTASSAMHQK